MNRGSAHGHSGDSSRRIRFNEAPIHESGKSSPTGRTWRTPWRFNEAPIHESGKLRRSKPRRAESPRFNEAPIHESGKCRLQWPRGRCNYALQ